MFTKFRSIAGALSVATAFVVSCALAVPAMAADPVPPTARAFAGTTTLSLENQTSAIDPRFFGSGIWRDAGSNACLRCRTAPALLAAVQASIADDSTANWVAINSIDTAIRLNTLPSGAFGPPAPGEGGPDIQTTLLAAQIGEAYLILGNRLDANHKITWARALTGAADFLMKNGNLSWYTNGNIALNNAIVIDLAARITGLQRFVDAAPLALNFAIAPDPQVWHGFGLQYSKQPTMADGSDGAAYFAESGAGGTGYDQSYTVAQDNMAAFWFLLTGSSTALRLTNLLNNQLMATVQTSDWTIDISNGTRHVGTYPRYGFFAASLPVLALRGGRTDLIPYVTAQSQAAFSAYKFSATQPGDGISYNFGSELAPMLLVLATTPGWS
ncbi:MAG: hypothetical protein JWN95_3571 [Frankiales bacterium]|nr:hypothetical protein [Frankiales bacterium]